MTTDSTAVVATAEISDGAQLSYRDVGRGEPILMIVGTAGSLGLWGPVEPALATSRRVISFDNRGLGGSTGGDGQLSTPDMADDAAALLDALGIERAHVVGWSMGSAIAQELALRHPERIGCLVLYGTWARLDGYQQVLLRAMRYPWAQGDLESALSAMGLCFSPTLLNSPDFPHLLEQFLPLFPQNAAQARVVARQWDAVFEHDTVGRLGAITTPTLVLSGAEDLIAPRRAAEQVTEAIPNAALARVDGPGSSHALHLERSDEFTRAITGFLDRHPIDTAITSTEQRRSKR